MQHLAYEICELPSGQFALIETMADEADVRLDMEGTFQGDTFPTREAAERELARRREDAARAAAKAA